MEEIFEPLPRAEQREADTPTSTSPALIATTVVQAVWPLLKDWISSKEQGQEGRPRFARFLKFIDPRNLRAALFEREKKAQKKYGQGLLVDENASFQPAVDKLSDAAFFLFKARQSATELKKNNINEYKRNMDLLVDLNNVLNAFIAEMK